MATASRPLLFDRLRRAPRHADASARAFALATITLEQHEDSVAEQLEWLLNTRAAWPADTLDDRTRAGLRSTVDYGLSDLSLYPLANAETMMRLARHLETVIGCYEPRIAAPKVTLEPGGWRDGMVVRVTGTLRFEGRSHPLQLGIPLRVEQGIGNVG